MALAIMKSFEYVENQLYQLIFYTYDQNIVWQACVIIIINIIGLSS